MSQLVLIEKDELTTLISVAVQDGYRKATHGVKSLPTYMNEESASIYLALSRSHLRKMRACGRGPMYSKIGNAIRYNVKDLDVYNQKNKVFTHD